MHGIKSESLKYSLDSDHSEANLTYIILTIIVTIMIYAYIF